MTISICDWTNRWKVAIDLPQNPEVEMQSVEIDGNQAYVLKMNISPALGSWYRKLIDEDRWGILLDDTFVKLGFIKAAKETVETAMGQTELTFYSTSFLLKSSQALLNSAVYSGSIQTFITNIDPQFEYRFWSPDKTINFQANAQNNFDLLKQVVFDNSWVYRDDGINDNGIPIIACGNAKETDSYYYNSGSTLYEPISLSNKNTESNAFDKRWGVLTKAVKNWNDEYITHLYAYVDSGTGTAENTRKTLTNPSATYIQPGFPLVLINGKYYIVNQQLYNEVGQARFWEENIALSQALEGTSLLNYTPVKLTSKDIEQQFYNKAVKLLRTKSKDAGYSYDLSFRRFILPFTKIKIDYTEKTKAIDGTEYITLDVQDTFLSRKVNYDAKDLAGMDL